MTSHEIAHKLKLSARRVNYLRDIGLFNPRKVPAVDKENRSDFFLNYTDDDLQRYRDAMQLKEQYPNIKMPTIIIMMKNKQNS